MSGKRFALVLTTAALAAGVVVATRGLAGETAGRASRVRLVIAPAGNEVRDRVREQLVGFDFPNDAVGRTTAVSGGMTIGSDGAVVIDAPRFAVNAGAVASDRDRRDDYVRGRLLAANEHPGFTFADFEIEKPRVRSVLSVADSIELECDFNLVTEPVPGAE